MLAKPFIGDGILLIHVLSELEIEESHLIGSEVAGQLDVDSASTISDTPLGVMIFLRAEATDSLAEVLSLLS